MTAIQFGIQTSKSTQESIFSFLEKVYLGVKQVFRRMGKVKEVINTVTFRKNRYLNRFHILQSFLHGKALGKLGAGRKCISKNISEPGLVWGELNSTELQRNR